MEDLRKQFEARYGKNGVLRFIRSPLRLCPLGAHVDHQRGLISGMALDAAVLMAYTPTEDNFIRVQSLDFPDEEYFQIDKVPSMLPGFWGNYLWGAVLALRQDYVLKRGFKAIISGRLPIGGLSSSAAVTTAYLMALCDVNGIVCAPEDLIRYSHWAENQFIGLENGILDQAANILSREHHLLWMDTDSGERKLLPQPAAMPEFEVAIVYSGISKSLISTDYNNRVDECRVAAWLLLEAAGLPRQPLRQTVLRDVPEAAYREHREKLPEHFRRRADHFFSENERVGRGTAAWEIGDLAAFGRLVTESGASSIENYECGCPELVAIYELLREAPGVYGARFSGAGYRGCCMGLVDPAYKTAISEMISREYPARFPQYKESFKIHFCKTADGAGFLS
jgi:galactokinase